MDPATYGTVALRASLAEGPSWTLGGGLSGGSAFEGEGGWMTGDLGVTGRRPLGRATFEVAAAVAAFRVTGAVDYEAVVARAVPGVRLRLGLLHDLHLRAHAGLGRSVSGAGTAELREDLHLLGGGAGWSSRVGRSRLHGSADAYHTKGGGYAAGAVGAEVPLGPLRLGGEIQLWSVPGDVREEEVALSATLALPLGGGASVRSGGGRSSPDPLLGTSPGRYGSLLLRWERLGSLPGPADPVVSFAGDDRGTVRFRLGVEAQAVEVLGDFSGWEPVPLRRTGDGWEVEIVVPAGVHHFAFRVDGAWMVPEGAPGRGEDEWGRPTATLVAPARDQEDRSVVYGMRGPGRAGVAGAGHQVEAGR